MTAAPFQPRPGLVSGLREELPDTNISGLIRGAILGVGLLGLGFVAATFLQLDGAVVTQGHVLMAGKSQSVQSLEPGLVANVAVKEGDRVEAGEILMTLDPTQPRTQLEIANERLANALAEEARLTAEASGADQPDFQLPPLPFPAPDMSRATARQTALFNTRQRQHQEARRTLVETDAQLQAQIEGLKAQLIASREQIRLLQLDMDRQATLVAQGLAREAQLNQMRRDMAGLSGQIANQTAEIARLEGSRREAALRLAQQESSNGADVGQALRDATASVQELTSQIVSLRDLLARTELRAPVSGIIHELTAPAPGTVVAAGTPVAQIVPSGQALEIEVAVDPRNIDSLHEGQAASVQLTAFDPRTMPKMSAKVARLPPGAVTDQATGKSFYRVLLELPPETLPPGVALRAGMPVQAFITTGERSLLDWLVAPLARPIAKAMRED